MISRPLSVIVTAWNCEKTIQRCLRSVAELRPQEIVVCDPGATDGGPSFASARNAGLSASSQPYVLFIDGDWIADAASVDELIRELSARPAHAIVVPRFMDDLGNDHAGHNVRRFPTSEALAAEFLMLHKTFGSEAVRKYRMLDFDHVTDRDIDHSCGAFILARREALVSVGGYDESFEGAWFEDIDLAQRLRRHGWLSRYCSSAVALHIGRETQRHFFIERYYDAYYRSVLRYTAKYLSNDYELVRMCLLAGLVSKAAFSYGLPARFRESVLRRLGIYNTDETIQGYRGMYLRSIDAVLGMHDLC